MNATRPALLVVTMGTDYIAPARMPRELGAAGFSVSLLAPEGALATRTRFVERQFHFPPEPTHLLWLQTVAHAAQSVRADLILPGDDITLRLLMQLVLAPLPALSSDVQQRLAALVERSLGDPAHYLDSVDKTRLVTLARKVGVPVPAGEAVANETDAVAVASALGYPVIVRPAFGSEGAGVAKCDDVLQVREAMRALPRVEGWNPVTEKVALVQRFVSGGGRNRPAAVWQGRELAGVTRAKIRSYPEPRGPSSVARYVAEPQLAAQDARLMAALGATGFLSTQYIVDERTGEALLIEINRRMTPATHTARLVGVDLAAAFAAGFHGREWTGPLDMPKERECTLALFPQEWLRDPESAELEAHPTDAPWDDPQLFAAMFDIGSDAAISPTHAAVASLAAGAAMAGSR
jgi:predicted ATP-grasp superfamily ATP-dependent carboligase